MSFSYIARRLFLVHKCAACRRILSRDEFEGALCSECELAFRVATTESCPECLRSAIECACQPKMLSSSGSLCLRRLYFYHTGKEKAPVNRLLYFIKHNRLRRASQMIAEEMLKLVKKELDILEVEDYSANAVIVNLPRGRKARALDGHDQSEEICKAMSLLSGIPYIPAIRRKWGGREQKKLNAAERRKNIKSLLVPREKHASDVSGRYVILVDDIVTTGASMAACLPILRKMGARGIICCCVASDCKKKKE